MEMLGERQNQPKIAPKQIKLQEIMEKGEEDRISALTDCLLLEILSRLPSTEDAIRTGALSKRWKYLWTWVPTLIFIRSDYHPTQGRQNPNSMSDYVSFVDKALAQCRQLKLKKFVLDISYYSRFESQVNSWIHYAMSRGVEELNLNIWNMESTAQFVLDQFFFISSCHTDLTLIRCILNPSGAISWKNLRSLCIYYANLDEDLIENILSGSPVLETLVLDYCYGYRRLDITSKSVKKLVFSGYLNLYTNGLYRFNVVEINAPNILSLTIGNHLMLQKLLLVNVSSIVEANLDFTKTHEKTKDVMVKGLILDLRHVKELKIGATTSKAVSRLEAKGFVFPSNIKFV